MVYAIEQPDGVVLVDSSWDGPESLDALDATLAVVRAGVADVRGVLVTHRHPDHSGLAARLHEETGAWIAAHDPEPSLVDPGGPAADLAGLDRWVESLGVPAGERDRFAHIARRLVEIHVELVPDRRLVSGTFVELHECRLEVIHTPGHAPDHACLVDHERRVVFTGDHILSQTTPNVGVFPGTRGNPLGRYLASLERVLGLGPLQAFPGHEERIPVDRRAAELIEHHASQLRHAGTLIASGRATIYDLAAGMPWSTCWEELGILDRYLAVCETHAHVVELHERGAVERDAAAPATLWRTAPGYRAA
jgi:glyoxylase-like metal-dependent hydrolase (beta-lactamase superfamily II)